LFPGLFPNLKEGKVLGRDCSGGEQGEPKRKEVTEHVNENKYRLEAIPDNFRSVLVEYRVTYQFQTE